MTRQNINIIHVEVFGIVAPAGGDKTHSIPKQLVSYDSPHEFTFVEFDSTTKFNATDTVTISFEKYIKINYVTPSSN